MARFEETSGLFGSCGGGTTSAITCDLCNTKYPKGRLGGDGISHDDFAGMEVCSCCYEVVENAVLARMSSIIPWFIRILKSQEVKLDQRKKMVLELMTALAVQRAKLGP
ncbi:MAG: hypothetical protein HYW38_01095 [Candidatus Colwellbacteria bacterium]|nr:hypothetical protein [Candidatus Colwellbacteria bacterium]